MKDMYGEPLEDMNEWFTTEKIESTFPFIFQQKVPTMDKKLIIEACMPGWQPVKWYRDRGVKNLPPISVEDQAQAIADCVKAGAAVIHTHPRDPQSGTPLVHAPDLFTDILDRAFDKVGDFVTLNHTWVWDLKKSPYVDYISATEELLERGKGNKYVQGGVVLAWGIRHYQGPEHSDDALKAGVKWYEEHDVKPVFQITSGRLWHFWHLLFDSGVAKWKPYILNIHTGKHGDDNIFSDPWSQLQTIHDIYMFRDKVPESRIGVYAGGRNWLPAAVQGIMQGCDIVRTGIEDQYWLWPHRDDISTYAAQTTELVVTIARALGREIATPAEAREMLGMKLTSG